MGAVGQALPWFLPALVIAVIDWFAVAAGNKKLEYFTKPLTIIALMIGVALLPGNLYQVCEGAHESTCVPDGIHVTEREEGFLYAALILSLAGDIFLMLPRDLFVAGLASFLGAHVSYIIAFQPSAEAREPLIIGTLVVLLFVGAFFYTQMRRGMVAKGKGALVPAVLIYIFAISNMVASAVANNVEADFPQPQAIVGTIGALLFYLSDAMIGWTRFVKDFKWSPVAIHVTYHLAQIGLVLSFVR